MYICYNQVCAEFVTSFMKEGKMNNKNIEKTHFWGDVMGGKYSYGYVAWSWKTLWKNCYFHITDWDVGSVQSTSGSLSWKTKTLNDENEEHIQKDLSVVLKMVEHTSFHRLLLECNTILSRSAISISPLLTASQICHVWFCQIFTVISWTNVLSYIFIMNKQD